MLNTYGNNLEFNSDFTKYVKESRVLINISPSNIESLKDACNTKIFEWEFSIRFKFIIPPTNISLNMLFPEKYLLFGLLQILKDFYNVMNF